MTFNEISLKIFRANVRRYLMYFLCSSFAITIFFTYASIYTNKSFMDPSNQKSTITSMLIAPGLAVMIFSVFFVAYAQSSFVKFRKSELGLLMVLGMTTGNIRKIILLENSLIGGASLLTGLISGTIFSRLFYAVIIKIIDIMEIPYSINFKSYLYTAIFFILIYFVVILITLAASARYEIITFIKSIRKEDRNLFQKPIWTVLGLLLLGAAFYDMGRNFSIENSTIVLRSSLLCFTGIYLSISGIISFKAFIESFLKRKSYENLLYNSNLKYTFGRTKNILFLITLLTTITIFFTTLAAGFIYDAQKFSVMYNPYDIAYAEIYGKNQLPEGTLDTILKNSDTPLKVMKNLEFIAEPGLTVLSDENLNTTLGTDLKVQKDHFISLFQIVEGDGYSHEINEAASLNLKTASGNNIYNTQGKITKVLFNNIPLTSAGYCIILNEEDYKDIKIGASSAGIGNIKLMNFTDWRKTRAVLEELQASLEAYNRKNIKNIDENIKEVSKVFAPSGKIKDYLERKQAGSFLLLLLSFVGLLFFISSAATLHFKLQTEYERERLKYTKLYKIGITDYEVTAVLSKELRILFFLPTASAALIAAFYSWCMPIQSGEGLLSLKYSLVTGFIYLLLQFIFYCIYKRFYIRKFIGR